jgi:hypothetical protein
VLSLESSKIEYDQPKGKELTEENYRSLDQLEDKSMAQKIMQYRQQTKKRYNINSLGRYNGGVPNPYSNARGDALDVPGTFHNVEMQRFYENSEFVSDFFVNRQDVVEYGRYMLDDRLQFGINRTWFRAKIDENYFSMKKYNLTLQIAIALFGIWAIIVWMNVFEKVFVQTIKKNPDLYELTESGILKLK